MNPLTQNRWLAACLLFFQLQTAAQAEQILTPKEQKKFRTLSQTILISNLAEKKSVEKNSLEKRNIIRKARRALKELEKGLGLHSVEVFPEPNTMLSSGVLTTSTKKNHIPIHLNPGSLVASNGKSTKETPAAFKAEIPGEKMADAANTVLQGSETRAVITRESRKIKIDRLLDTSIREFAKLQGDLEKIIPVKSPKNNTVKRFSKKTGPDRAVLIIQEIETELQAMKQTGPTLKKIQNLSERLIIKKNNTASKKIEPTFSTLVKHRE